MSNEEFERLRDFLLRQQAKFDERQAKFDERMNKSQAEFDERMSKSNAEFNERFGKLTDVLLSLTNIVGRHDQQLAALIEAGKETDRRMKETDERMKHTDERLNALIAVVNGLVEKPGTDGPAV